MGRSSSFAFVLGFGGLEFFGCEKRVEVGGGFFLGFFN